MTKVGEHITLDIIGSTKEYEPKFFEKLVYRYDKASHKRMKEIEDNFKSQEY